MSGDNQQENDDREKGSVSEEALRLEYENAKQRLSTQKESIKSFSKEGTRYFQLVLILVGVPVTLLSAFEPTSLTRLGSLVLSDRCIFDSGGCIPIRYLTISGFTCLLITGLVNIGAGGYEAYNTRSISNPSDIHDLTSFEDSTQEYLKSRLEDYRDRIEHNDRLIFSLDRWLMIGKLGLTLSMMILSVVAYTLAAGDTASPIELLGIFFGIGMVYRLLLLILPESVSNRGSMLRFDPPYSLEYMKEIEKRDKDTSNSSAVDEEGE
ncbi:hypothetical protein [Halorubrum salinum]|uniref:hypothetical protein n=1 Tax=Halorubrum salinum TaxID=767517 RepID=UPI002111AF2F|nr:hypothetical protein [Halorubrum salinum]